MYHDDAGHLIGPMPTYGPIEIDPDDVQPPFSVRHRRVIRSPVKLEQRLHLVHLLAGKCTIAIDGQVYSISRVDEGLTINSSSSAEITEVDNCILMVYSGGSALEAGATGKASRIA